MRLVLVILVVLYLTIITALTPLPLLFDGFLLIVLAVWLIRWKRKPEDTKLRRRVISYGLAFFCYTAILPVRDIVGSLRGQRDMSVEYERICDVGQALRMYNADWEGGFPPPKNWRSLLAVYSSSPGWRNFGERLSGEAVFGYRQPKPGEDPKTTVIVKVTDWEPRFGVCMLLYADGRAEKRLTWPWWKYVQTGSYPLAVQSSVSSEPQW